MNLNKKKKEEKVNKYTKSFNSSSIQEHNSAAHLGQ